MTLPKDTFEAIATQAVNAAGVNARSIRLTPGEVVHIETAPGQFVQREGRPPLRAHEARKLESLVELAKRHHAQTARAVIWYQATKVVAILDDRDRLDYCTLDLSFSRQFEKLIEFDRSRVMMSQADILYLFRTLFKKCLTRAGDAYEVLKKLKFKVHSDVDTENARTKVSLGKSIISEATGVVAIPEYVVLAVPVYADKFMTEAAVECFLHLDVPNERLGLIPLPGEIERAVGEAEDTLRYRIDRELQAKPNEDEATELSRIPVYCGGD